MLLFYTILFKPTLETFDKFYVITRVLIFLVKESFKKLIKYFELRDSEGQNYVAFIKYLKRLKFEFNMLKSMLILNKCYVNDYYYCINIKYNLIVCIYMSLEKFTKKHREDGKFPRN